jgi:iron complex outermembrane receptor protein
MSRAKGIPSVICGAIVALTASEALRAETLESGAAGAGLDEVVVTATKKERAQNVQEVPIAVTAFGSQQLEALNFQNLT